MHDPQLARKRHEAARRTAGVHGRPLPDGMGQVVIDCTAVQMATALAAIDGRAAAMSEGVTRFRTATLAVLCGEC